MSSSLSPSSLTNSLCSDRGAGEGGEEEAEEEMKRTGGEREGRSTCPDSIHTSASFSELGGGRGGEGGGCSGGGGGWDREVGAVREVGEWGVEEEVEPA
uniref:Uncharacterized protein n=1 Tax=Knipowitschia caucasica TaxID=637954 RepID=A0AAV2K1H3_KNICA